MCTGCRAPRCAECNSLWAAALLDRDGSQLCAAPAREHGPRCSVTGGIASVAAASALAPSATTEQCAGVVITEMSDGDDDEVASISHLFDDDAQIAETRRFLTFVGSPPVGGVRRTARRLVSCPGIEMTHPGQGNRDVPL